MTNQCDNTKGYDSGYDGGVMAVAVEEQTKLQAELEELDGTVRAIEVEVNYLTEKLHMVLLPEPVTKDVSENMKEAEQSELLGILRRITDRANRQRLELYSMRSRIEL